VEALRITAAEKEADWATARVEASVGISRDKPATQDVMNPLPLLYTATCILTSPQNI